MNNPNSPGPCFLCLGEEEARGTVIFTRYRYSIVPNRPGPEEIAYSCHFCGNYSIVWSENASGKLIGSRLEIQHHVAILKKDTPQWLKERYYLALLNAGASPWKKIWNRFSMLWDKMRKDTNITIWANSPVITKELLEKLSNTPLPQMHEQRDMLIRLLAKSPWCNKEQSIGKKEAILVGSTPAQWESIYEDLIREGNIKKVNASRGGGFACCFESDFDNPYTDYTVLLTTRGWQYYRGLKWHWWRWLKKAFGFLSTIVSWLASGLKN